MPSAQSASLATLLGYVRSIDWKETVSLFREGVGGFVRDLRDPASAVAFGCSAFIVIASTLSVLLSDPNGIRAHAPPPPTRVQIEQANRTAVEFSTISPAERAGATAEKR